MGFTAGDLHIDAPLTNMVIGFEPQGTIVQNIFPEVPVGKQSDKYYVWDKADFFRIPDTKRSPKTKGRTVEFNVSSESYFADNFALVHEESFEAMGNADAVLKGREKRVRALKKLLMLDWENRVASVISSASNLGSGTTLTGASQWSSAASCDPIDDVDVGKEFIRLNTGLDANLIIIPQAVVVKLRQTAKIQETIKYTRLGIVTPEVLQSVFEIEKVLIPKSIKNTGEEGQATTMTDIWGDNVIIAHVTDGPDPDGKDPSLGYTFRWNAPELNSQPFAAEIWNDPDGGNFENRRVMTYQDEKITAPELGYVIIDTLA